MNKQFYLQILAVLLTASFLGSCNNKQHDKQISSLSISTQQDPISFDLPFTLQNSTIFYLVNDVGRNGYYEQKPIADLLGRMGEERGPDCIVAAGDTQHFDGEASANDPLW